MRHRDHLALMIQYNHTAVMIGRLFFRYLLNYFEIATRDAMNLTELRQKRSFSDDDIIMFFEKLGDVTEVETHARYDDVSQHWDEANRIMTDEEVRVSSDMLKFGPNPTDYMNYSIFMNTMVFEICCKKPSKPLGKKTNHLINRMAMKALQSYVCISDAAIIALDHARLMGTLSRSWFFTKILKKSYIADFIHEFVMTFCEAIEEDEEAFGETEESHITGFFTHYQKLVIHKCREMGVEHSLYDTS